MTKSKGALCLAVFAALGCGQVVHDPPCKSAAECATGETCADGSCVASDSGVSSGGGAPGGAGGLGSSGGEGGLGANGGVGASGGAAGSGGNVGSEDCTDGVDNDGNGHVDCEDPGCQPAFWCAPAIPLGWTGPVALFEGAAPAPDCSSSGFPIMAQDAYADIDGGTVACPSCQCNVTSSSCTAALQFFSDPACGGSCWLCSTPFPFEITAGDPCQPIPPLCHDGNKKPVAVEVQVKGSASCTPVANGSEVIPKPAWGKSVRACGHPKPAGGGCAAGTCLPKPHQPFEQAFCIYADGDVPCPGVYVKKRLAHLAFSDNRDCTACGCGEAAGVTCDDAVVFLGTEVCVTAGWPVKPNKCSGIVQDQTLLSGTCDGGADADTRSAKLLAKPSGGACSPSGGQAVGSVYPKAPITFCCM